MDKKLDLGDNTAHTSQIVLTLIANALLVGRLLANRLLQLSQLLQLLNLLSTH